MATNDNTIDLTNNNLTITDKAFKADPIAWAKSGNKIVYGDVRKLIPLPNVNIRHRAGSELFGVKVVSDTLDISGMQIQLMEGGGINEPILVSLRKDDSMIVLRGNRRTYAGQTLADDPTTPDHIRKQLCERTPMILLKGLTIEQELQLVNDQTQKKFMRSEIVKHIYALKRMGQTYEQIVSQFWEQLTDFNKTAKSAGLLAEMREMSDPVAKLAKIKAYYRGTLENYLLWAYDLGPAVQKCVLLSEARLDGVKFENDERPYFDTTKNSQKRIAALRKAKEQDGTKWTGLMFADGSEFKKVADKFHAEDFGPKDPNATPATKTPKMLDRATVTALRNGFGSVAVKQALTRCLGETADELQMRDDETAVYEAKQMLVNQYLPNLRPDVAAIVRFCLVTPDMTDFTNFLEANVLAEEMPVESNEVADATNETAEYKLTDANDNAS